MTMTVGRPVDPAIVPCYAAAIGWPRPSGWSLAWHVALLLRLLLSLAVPSTARASSFLQRTALTLAR